MKRILLVADEPGWIFERHCLEIKKRLTEYQIDIAFCNDNVSEMSINYDLVYVLDPMIMSLPPAKKTIMGLRCEYLYRKHPEGAKGLYEKGTAGRCFPIKDNCCIFHVVNKNQLKIFAPIVTDIPLLLAQHGVDEEIFDRTKYKKAENKVLIASLSGRGKKYKGFEIIQKACFETGFELIEAQYGKRKLSKDEMPEFYSRADVHICMSRLGSEGLNNPTLEAGAMGIPVISTRSGAAEEMIRDGENGLLVERNVTSLVNALQKIKDYDLRKDMGEKFHEEIMKHWTWKVRIEDFRKMFSLFFEKTK